MESLKEMKLEMATITLKSFCVKTERPEEFIEKLEELCRKYSRQEDFFFKYSIEG